MNSISEISSQLMPKTAKGNTAISGDDSFQNTLNGFLKEANKNITEAGEMVDKFSRGEITEIHDVMIASQKASVSLEMVVEIRNKMVEAYKELMRIQV